MNQDKWLKEMKARQLRQVKEGLYRKIHPEVPEDYWIEYIGKMTIEDMVSSYLMCPDCGELSIPVEVAIDLISSATDTDDWLDSCHEMAKSLHHATAIAEAAREKMK